MEQITIPCTYMRTGTSKSVYFKKEVLPADPKERDRILLEVMGSPDPIQIDGMGGGSPSTSKIAIISRSEREDADIDYTFGQVSLTEKKISYTSNCGNCSSGVGPFAVDEGLVEVTEPVTVVRVYNTNTNKILTEYVPVKDKKAQVCGDYKIDGIPGTGARIGIDLSNTVGAYSGRLFPTENRIDYLEIDGQKIPVTLMDLGNPIVYVHAKYVGAVGNENRNEINNNAELMKRLETIREKAAVMLGVCHEGECAAKVSPNIPLISFFHEPMDTTDYVSGKLISANDIDFVARNLFMLKAIDTYTAIGATNTAICSVIPGTVLYEASAHRTLDRDMVIFGNPRGFSDAQVHILDTPDGVVVEKAIMGRTARRIMDGVVYVKNPTLE